MNEGTSMKDGPGTGEAAGLDAQGAAVIAQEARERARRELWVRRPVLFVTWGLFLLVVAAAGATANVVDRAASGVGGRSELRRGILALALVVGFAALEIEKQALWHAGAGRPIAALFGEAIPLLVAGLVFVASSAV